MNHFARTMYGNFAVTNDLLSKLRERSNDNCLKKRFCLDLQSEVGIFAICFACIKGTDIMTTLEFFILDNQ